MGGQPPSSVSLKSLAIAGLFHVGVAAALLSFSGDASGGGGSPTIIPVELVALPKAPSEAPAEPPAAPPPQPAPEPEPEQIPEPEPQLEPAPQPAPPETPSPSAQPAPEPSTPAPSTPVSDQTPPASDSDSAAPQPDSPTDGAHLAPQPEAAPAAAPPEDTKTAAGAAGPGAAQKSAGTGPDPLFAWHSNVRRQLMRHAPKGVAGARNCEVAFQLSEDGAVISAEITRTSTSPRFDRRCLKAIRQAAPYPAAPQGTAETDRYIAIEIRQPR